MGARASVDEMIGPPNGSIGNVTLFEPVASNRCSQRMRWPSTSTCLPSRIFAQPWMTLTPCFFNSAATPVVRRSTMPSFQATLRPMSRRGEETLMPSSDSPL
ncbi:hypothetical protein D3C76_1402820 [compost metagenome]